MHAPELLESRIAPATLLASDVSNNLLSFDSATPGTVTSIPITGLAAGETIEGLDVRPASGELYALAITDTAGPDEGRIYKISPTTGAATAITTTPFSTTLADGARYGFDFNPVVDRIRIVNDAGENMRVNPNTGLLVATDATLSGGAALVGSAYDRNAANTTATTLFGIDSGSDMLVRQGGVDGSPSPNGGTVTNIGPLGVNTSGAVGFDIENVSGKGYATLTVGGVSGLYTIDLTTGAATLIGTVGGGAPLRGLAVATFPGITLVNPQTATYLDQDGDRVTVTTTKGAFSATDFTFSSALNGGGQLRLLNLSDNGAEFDGANLVITAKPTDQGGDGHANIGYINSTGHDLGVVRVSGDLGQIDAGDAITATPGLKGLNVVSLGRFGTSTQLPNGAIVPTLQSDIVGALGKLAVSSDVFGAHIDVTGGLDGKIGSVIVGGSVIGDATTSSGAIVSTGDIASVKIGGDLQGVGVDSGRVQTAGNLGKIQIRGSVIGDAQGSGGILVAGGIGTVKIGRDLHGGSGDETGRISSGGKLGSLTVGGSIIGGTGDYALAQVFSSGAVATLTVGGSILGGAGSRSAAIEIDGKLGSLTVGDNITGSAGISSALINAPVGIDSLAVGGSLVGGSGDSSANVRTELIGTLLIGADLVGKSGLSSAQVNATTINTATIRGSIIGGDGGFSGTLGDQRIDKVTVLGNVEGGRGATSGGIRALTKIGSVTIKGSLIGGMNTGPNDTLNAGVIAGGTINAITIGGDIRGASLTGGGDVNFAGGILATAIGRLTVGGSILAGTDSGAGSLDGSGFVRVVNDIGTIVVKGSLVGNQTGGAHEVLITARGQVTPGPTDDIAIKSIAIGGRVELTRILAGYGQTGTGDDGDGGLNADAKIGKVLVGHDWIASTIAAGVDDNGDGFGNANDAKLAGASIPDNAGIVSTIASIVINGQALGTVGGTDHFGFVAQQIGSLKIGAVSVPLLAGPGNDLAGIPIGATGDLRAREVAL